MYRVALPVPPELLSAVHDRLDEQADPRWSLYEDIVKHRAELTGIFRDRRAASAAWRIFKAIPVFCPNWDKKRGLPGRRLRKAEWAESYKRHFKAWRFGRLHWVPVWQKKTFRLPRGHSVLWLDPGMAFGTGNHPTTRLVCERLAEIADGRLAIANLRRARNRQSPIGNCQSLLDCGCGSGILALSGALLGFKPVSAFDNDPLAVRVSRQNAALNALSRKAQFFVADVKKGCRRRRADVVVANIQADVLVRHARDLLRSVAPGGTLVLSGILATELGAVRRAYRVLAPEWRSRSRHLDEWADLELITPRQ